MNSTDRIQCIECDTLVRGTGYACLSLKRKSLTIQYIRLNQEETSFRFLAAANLVLYAVKTVYNKDGVTPKYS